jgi:hypothetical protein
MVAFYTCKTSTYRSRSDTTEGFRSIENKNFPTTTNKNKPRSDLRDAKQRVRENISTYPCRSHSRNVQMNVVGVVVLASPPRDPIRSKRHNGRRLERCTRTSQWRLLLLGPARCGGVVDGISSTTTWCLWWRVSAGRASPTRVRWKKIG